jgi:hypothetical protein
MHLTYHTMHRLNLSRIWRHIARRNAIQIADHDPDGRTAIKRVVMDTATVVVECAVQAAISKVFLRYKVPVRGGEKFAQFEFVFEFVFEFSNIRRIRILKMLGGKSPNSNSNSNIEIRILIESCFKNSRIFSENSNSLYDSA